MKNKIPSEEKDIKKVNVVNLTPKEKKKAHKFNLVLGSCRELFSSNIRNILIARALNYCVRKKGLVINGYLITDRTICLIVKCRKYSLKRTINKFEKRLGKDIRSYLKYVKNPCCPLKRKKHKHKNKHWKPSFKICPLTDYNLIKLITGKKVELPYYSPSLAVLIDLIDNYNFCSALDYTKAKGPVLVKKIRNHEYAN